MKRASRLRKFLWIIPLTLLFLLVAGFVALRFYLSSASATGLVAGQLQDLLGGRVVIADARIATIGDSSVHGIEVYEEGKPEKSWLRIDDAIADVSALSALCGQSPNYVHLKGARVVLHFDRDGHLLTKLPSGKKGAPTAMPRLRIQGGELTLHQETRSPAIFRGLDVEVASSEGGLTLTGKIGDPFWGDWKLGGSFDGDGGKGGLTLDAEQIAVTMPKLKAIPFVPLSVWNEIHVEGTTPAKVRLDLASNDGKPNVRYRVEIAPRNARIKVPSINLEASEANGKAVVADEIVEVHHVRGTTAGGTIHAGGMLNFHDSPSRLDLKVGVRDVVLHDLPSSWDVPSFLDGKLTGTAKVVVTLKKGKAETAGSGEGEIREARVSGFRPKKPIRLALSSDGRRYHFHVPKASEISRNDDKESRAETPLENPVVVRNEPVVELIEQPENNDLLSSIPGEAINWVGRGLQWGAGKLARGIDAVASGLKKLKPPSKPGEAPTYLNVDLGLQNVDLAQMVKKLKLNLPYAVTGRLTFNVHVAIPINTANDLKAYRLNGDATLSSFNMAGLSMSNVEAKVRYADGVLDLEKLSGQIPSAKEVKTFGNVKGNARVEVVPRGALQAELKLEHMPTETMLGSFLPGKGVQSEVLSGALSGEVKVRAPLEKLSDPATWRGSANLSSPHLKLYGVPMRDASASLVVDEVGARLTALKAQLEGAPLTGEAELRLKDSYPFKAALQMGQADLSALNRLPESFRPPVAVAGRVRLNGVVSGTLTPLQFDTHGEFHGHNIVAEGVAVNDLSFRWTKDKDGMKLDAIRADLFGGSASGSGVVPLDAAGAGKAHLNVHDLDLQAVAKTLPALPFKVEGKVSGKVEGTLDPAQKNRPRAWTANVELSSPQMRVQDIPSEKVKCILQSRDGKADYNLQGETLGGTFTLKGDLHLPGSNSKEKQSAAPVGSNSPALQPVSATAPQKDDDQTAGRGRFELHNASLSRLWKAYQLDGGLKHLNGHFSIVLDYELTGPRFSPSGRGTFRIVNIRWDEERFANYLQGEAQLSAEEMQLHNITGDVAGGQFVASLVFGLAANRGSHFQLDLQQVEASRLLLPWPDIAAKIKGPLDVNLRGRIGREWDGVGGASFVRGQIYGMDVPEWRIPLTFRYSPSQGNGEVTVRDSHARLAQGRARFESTLNWGNGLRLNGLLVFYQVDLRTLLRNSPEVSAYASGRVSGRVDLAGSEMRSVNDLTAVVQAKMEQGQALQFPVLRQITPYLRPGVSSATFQSGTLKGRLTNGIFRIQHAALVGDFVKVLMQGTINLSGNLNLDVTAQSGLYALDTSRANAVRARIPLIGVIPRLVIYEASSILSAAVVHLRVTGTTRSPVIHLEPLIVMTEESIRFFLGRAVGLDIPALP
jgi:translocation and assembly module TamB